MHIGSDDSDSEEESVEKSEVGSEAESDSSLNSEQIRRKRKVFDRKQKRRLDKLLRTNRGRKTETLIPPRRPNRLLRHSQNTFSKLEKSLDHPDTFPKLISFLYGNFFSKICLFI